MRGHLEHCVPVAEEVEERHDEGQNRRVLHCGHRSRRVDHAVAIRVAAYNVGAVGLPSETAAPQASALRPVYTVELVVVTGQGSTAEYERCCRDQQRCVSGRHDTVSGWGHAHGRGSKTAYIGAWLPPRGPRWWASSSAVKVQAVSKGRRRSQARRPPQQANTCFGFCRNIENRMPHMPITLTTKHTGISLA